MPTATENWQVQRWLLLRINFWGRQVCLSLSLSYFQLCAHSVNIRDSNYHNLLQMNRNHAASRYHYSFDFSPGRQHTDLTNVVSIHNSTGCIGDEGADVFFIFFFMNTESTKALFISKWASKRASEREKERERERERERQRHRQRQRDTVKDRER